VGESVKLDYDTLSIFKRLKGGGIPSTPCVGDFEVFCGLIVIGCNKMGKVGFKPSQILSKWE